MTHARPPASGTWLLCDDRPGNVTQALGLAEALGLSCVHKRLAFRKLAEREIPLTRAPLLGAFGWPTRIGIDTTRSDALTPPWPAVVIAAGGRCAPVARWIRSRSRGTTRVIVLGRKAALCTNRVDLAIAPRTARLPEDPRRIETLAPLHRLHRDMLDAAAAAHAALEDAPRPRITLVVGGSAGRYRFGATEARDLAAKVLALASRSRGSLFVTTSRRTGEEASAALAESLASNPSVRELHRFRSSADPNPYLALLGGADVLVVTGESESMLAEAASTGHLVLLALLPERAPTLRRRLRETVTRVAEGSGAGRFAWLRHVAAALITHGLLLPPRNLERLHDDLVGIGIAQRLTEESTVSAPITIAPLDESTRVAAEVRKRLEG